MSALWVLPLLSGTLVFATLVALLGALERSTEQLVGEHRSLAALAVEARALADAAGPAAVHR